MNENTKHRTPFAYPPDRRRDGRALVSEKWSSRVRAYQILYPKNTLSSQKTTAKSKTKKKKKKRSSTRKSSVPIVED